MTTNELVWTSDLGIVDWDDIPAKLTEHPGHRLPTVQELQSVMCSAPETFPETGIDFWSANDNGTGKRNFVVMAVSGSVNDENDYAKKPMTHLKLVEE